MSSANDFILSTSGLTKKFDGLTAVNDVTLNVERGSIKAIIGPNGSGKTTFFNLITGVFPPTSGKIYFEGQDITRFSMHDRTRQGISRSYQITNIFHHLSLTEPFILRHAKANFILTLTNRSRHNIGNNLPEDIFSNAIP